MSKPQEGRRASIEAVTTGAVIFSAAVGYVAVQNQLVFLWQVAALSTLGAFAILWLAVFGTPVIRFGWRKLSRIRSGNVSALVSRVEALERQLKTLSDQTQMNLAFVSLLEFSWGTTTVVLLGDRMPQEQFLQRLRTTLPTARTIAQHLSMIPNSSHFQAMLSSSIDLLVFTGHMKGVPFERMASLLISELGITTAREVVTVSSIIDAYGADFASKWRSLVGQT